MGMDIKTCTLVGLSFVEAWEKDDDVLDKIEEVAEELKLDSEIMMREPDKISDVFIGISFSSREPRPTDKQIEEARETVQGLVKQIEEKMGHKASSKVTEWNVVTVTY